MCGIAGIIRYGNQPINEEQISLFLTGNEHRGNDATGMAFQQADGSIQVFKKDIPAWRFVSDDLYSKFIEDNLLEDTRSVILHTRGATQGSPRVNNNNHPMFYNNTAVVHNGCINNDDNLFKELKIDRRAETDSDILRGILDEYGMTQEGIRKLSRVNGSAAGAAISVKYPNKMLIFRSGSPMTLGSTDDFFVFSSEKNTIHRAMRPWVKRFGTFFQVQKPDMAFSPMADNTAWIMGPGGLEYHGDFRALVGSYIEPFRRTYEGYADREAKWGERDTCATASAKVVAISDEHKREMVEVRCPECKHPWTIAKGENPQGFECAKDRNGCGNKTLEFMPEETTVA